MFKRRSFLGYFSIASLASTFPAILTIFNSRKATAKITNDNVLGVDDKDNPKAAVLKNSEGFTVIGSVSDIDLSQ
jgi:cytochrome b6-f complex iron-sulfur subunit